MLPILIKLTMQPEIEMTADYWMCAIEKFDKSSLDLHDRPCPSTQGLPALPWTRVPCANGFEELPDRSFGLNRHLRLYTPTNVVKHKIKLNNSK